MKRLISVIISLALVISLLPVGSAVGTNGSLMSRDELVANYNAVEQSVFTASKSEFGYCSSKNSSTLAWAASYMLESYAAMYKNTGDRKYLKSLGVQFREALENLNFDYGEDRPGWDAPNYSVKRMNDPEFDKVFLVATSADSVSTNAWMRKFGSDDANVNVEYDVGRTERGLHIISGGGKLQGAKIDIASYAPDTIFQLSIYYKGTASARAYITTADGEILKTTDGREYPSFTPASSYKNYTFRYHVPESGEMLTIHLESADADSSGDIYFDTVAFQQAAQFHVHDMMMVSAGAKFVEAVYKDEELASAEFESGKTYKDIADEFLPELETLIAKWDFCWKEDGDIGVYTWPQDDSSAYRGNVLPHNQYIKMACAMMPLYDVTGKSRYLERATKMLTFFKRNLKTGGEEGNEYYYWNYYDPAFSTDYTSQSPEDISHGCLELDAAIMAYERGLIFTEDDMKKFANAFVTMLWNGDLENPVFYNNLTNNPSHASYHKVMTSELNVRDWARLGKWNPEIAIAITNYMTQHSPTSGHPTKMLAYSYAYPYIFNDFKWILISKTSGASAQIENETETVEFSLKTNAGIDETILDNTVWTVAKDSDNPVNIATGRTASYKPEAVGAYTITAVLDGKNSTYKITVEEKEEENGGGGSGGGGSGGGGSGGGGSGGGGSGGGGSGGGGSGGGGSGSGGSGSGGSGGGGSVAPAPVTPDNDKETESNNPEYNESEVPAKKTEHHKNFNDTKNGGWYSDAIDHVVEKGIMSGTSNGNFEPNGHMTRAMLAKVLHNMEKNPKSSGSIRFTDVKSGEWYAEAVLWAAEMNIVTGYGNGRFGANDHITREQLAVMLWRYSGCKKADTELSFSDSDKVSDWALDAMRWAVENKIINGKSDNVLAPHSKATRAEVAQMLMNFTKK